jgi:hypothetical protein
MARIRAIKPAFFHDLVIGDLPIPTRLTYIGLWTYLDDEGRGVDDARLIKAELWPLDDNYTTKKVEKDLEMLTKMDRICRYEVQGKGYLHVVRWKHQRINRPQPSLLPHCAFTEHSVNAHGTISEHSPPVHGTISDRSRPEGKGREGNPLTPLASTFPQAVDNVEEKEEESEEEEDGRRTAGSPDGPPPTAHGNLAVAQTPRSQGTNPRAVGTNPRATGTNPRALASPDQTALAAQALMARNGKPPCQACDGNGWTETGGIAVRCPVCST